MRSALADFVMTDTQVDSLFGAGTAERFRLKTWHAATDDGRAARAIGQTLADCQPFADHDLTVSWRLGWYDEDKRRDPKGFEAREVAAAAIDPPPAEQTPRAARSSRWRQFKCPKCGADPGRGCISATGKPLPDEHAARRKA